MVDNNIVQLDFSFLQLHALIFLQLKRKNKNFSLEIKKWNVELYYIQVLRVLYNDGGVCSVELDSDAIAMIDRSFLNKEKNKSTKILIDLLF